MTPSDPARVMRYCTLPEGWRVEPLPYRDHHGVWLGPSDHVRDAELDSEHVIAAVMQRTETPRAILESIYARTRMGHDHELVLGDLEVFAHTDGACDCATGVRRVPGTGWVLVLFASCPPGTTESILAPVRRMEEIARPPSTTR
jgi:hypothetical protein